MLLRKSPFRAVVDIYNMYGDHVRSISTDVQSLHESDIVWDGNDDSGNPQPPGVYAIRIIADDGTGNSVVRKVVAAVKMQ